MASLPDHRLAICLTGVIDAISASATRAGLLALLAVLVVALSVVALPGLLADGTAQSESTDTTTDSARRGSDDDTRSNANGRVDSGAALLAVARVSSEGIVLDGTVATEGQRDALVDTARRRVGPALVQDNLTVTTGEESSAGRDNGVVALQSFLAGLPADVTVAATTSATELTVVGSARSDDALATLENALATAAAGSPDLQTTNDVVVPPPPPPTPEELAASAQEELDVLNAELAATVLFATSSNEPTQEFIELLDSVPETLSGHPTVSVEVVGHTDDRGSSEGNQKLSDQRAKAAADYLLSLGLDRSRVTYRGAGETEPIATNSTRDGRAANRRVVLTAR